MKRKINIQKAKLPKQLYGFTIFKLNLIVISESKPKCLQFETLIHEFAHLILPKSFLFIELVDKIDILKFRMFET